MFAEDLSVFFNTSEFAVTATVAGAGVSVIFDNGYQGALNGFLESSAPSITGPSASLATAVQGTAVTVNAIAYKVMEVHPDGTGITKLMLEKA
jgi:hypothetical protein